MAQDIEFCTECKHLKERIGSGKLEVGNCQVAHPVFVGFSATNLQTPDPGVMLRLTRFPRRLGIRESCGQGEKITGP